MILHAKMRREMIRTGACPTPGLAFGCGQGRRQARRRRGFTLVELLISVALLAMLLGAIAAATHASLMAYRQNTSAADLTQMSRLLMMRITREVRTATAVDYNAGTSQLIIYPPTNDDGLQQVKYVYSSVTKTLTYTQTINGTPTSQVLLSNTTPIKMTYFFVRYTTAQDPQGVFYTQRVTVTMDFQMNGRTTRMVCSAAPRCNLQL